MNILIVTSQQFACTGNAGLHFIGYKKYIVGTAQVVTFFQISLIGYISTCLSLNGLNQESGHMRMFCDETDTLLVLPAGLRTEACPYHHLVTLSANESQRIYENCANTEPTLRKSWFTLPPVWEWYYKQHHPEYKPLPPFKAGCGEDTFQPMQFIYPPMNARIKLPKQLDGSKGFLTVELAHNNPNATVFWHLDETYQAQTQDFHKISLQPAAGKHSLTAVDGEGNTISTTFFVE